MSISTTNVDLLPAQEDLARKEATMSVSMMNVDLLPAPGENFVESTKFYTSYEKEEVRKEFRKHGRLVLRREYFSVSGRKGDMIGVYNITPKRWTNLDGAVELAGQYYEEAVLDLMMEPVVWLTVCTPEEHQRRYDLMRKKEKRHDFYAFLHGEKADKLMVFSTYRVNAQSRLIRDVDDLKKSVKAALFGIPLDPRVAKGKVRVSRSKRWQRPVEKKESEMEITAFIVGSPEKAAEAIRRLNPTVDLGNGSGEWHCKEGEGDKVMEWILDELEKAGLTVIRRRNGEGWFDL